MIKNKNVFYGVYEVIQKNVRLKNGNIKKIEIDEIPILIDDYVLNICKFLNNKIDSKHISTYLKNKTLININNKYYRVYKFIEE